MSLVTSPIIGTITVEPSPCAGAGSSAVSDDSSLGTLLSSFAYSELLTELPLEGKPILLFASTRLSRSAAPSQDSPQVVRADLARLLEDLQDEYEDLACRHDL